MTPAEAAAEVAPGYRPPRRPAATRGPGSTITAFSYSHSEKPAPKMRTSSCGYKPSAHPSKRTGRKSGAGYADRTKRRTLKIAKTKVMWNPRKQAVQILQNRIRFRQEKPRSRADRKGLFFSIATHKKAVGNLERVAKAMRKEGATLKTMTNAQAQAWIYRLPERGVTDGTISSYKRRWSAATTLKKSTRPPPSFRKAKKRHYRGRRRPNGPRSFGTSKARICALSPNSSATPACGLKNPRPCAASTACPPTIPPGEKWGGASGTRGGWRAGRASNI